MLIIYAKTRAHHASIAASALSTEKGIELLVLWSDSLLWLQNIVAPTFHQAP